MTFDELERSLPNGFHDSHIRRVSVDYQSASARLDMVVDFGSPETGPNYDPRDVTLALRGVRYLITDRPAPLPPTPTSELDIVDAHDSAEAGLLSASDSIAPIAKSFFVNDWNSFIHIAAESAELIWPEK